MSLLGIGEKIMSKEVAASKKEYTDQLDTFYSYCRWYQVIQKLGQDKNDELANLTKNATLFMHVFSAVHMDDDMVAFLMRSDEELLYEIQLFAALDKHEVETFRTGWVRIDAPDLWPQVRDSNGKMKDLRIEIKEGTKLQPIGQHADFVLQTAHATVMIKSDSQGDKTGLVIPVRAASSTHQYNLPEGTRLKFVNSIEHLNGAATGTEIRFRTHKKKDIEALLEKTLLTHLYEATPVKDLEEKLEKEGLSGSPALVRMWMERNTGTAWKLEKFAGTMVDLAVLSKVALRLTSYVDMIYESVTKSPGLLRGTIEETLKLPTRVITEPYKQFKNWRSKEPSLNLKERWKSTWDSKRTYNTRRFQQIEKLKTKLRNLGREEPNVPDNGSEQIEVNERGPVYNPITPTDVADSARSSEPSIGNGVNNGAIEADGNALDVQENMNSESLSNPNQLVSDSIANEQSMLMREVNENREEKATEESESTFESESPKQRIVVAESSDAPELNATRDVGIQTEEITPNEPAKVAEGEGMVGDAAGIVLFVVIDTVMGIVEAEKQKEAWEDAAESVKNNVNLIGNGLKQIIREYEGLINQYAMVMSLWNTMLTDVFVNKKDGTPITYPELMQLAQGEHRPPWYKNYVPLDSQIFETQTFKDHLLKDGLPRELQNTTDPQHFVDELKNTSNKQKKSDKNLKINDWNPQSSTITWEDLQVIAKDEGLSIPDDRAFSNVGTSMNSQPLNVFAKWSERYTINMGHLLDFRTDYIHWISNHLQEGPKDWSVKVDAFAKQLEQQLNLFKQIGSHPMDKFAAYKITHPGAPSESYKNGTTEKKLEYYTYLYNYLGAPDGLNIKVADITSIPIHNNSLDLSKKLEDHIRIWASDKSDASHLDEYIRECERIAPEFGFYSDLLLASHVDVSPE